VAPVASTAPAARRLSRLPFSRDEADRILAMVPPALSLKALDFDANRGAAMSPALSAYRIVHFGTHAVRDDRHPELSGIVLSLVDPRGRKQNGFLRLQDLYNLHLGADLVVLSACETAVGVAAGGEGLASMARGFFYAGAVRVVAALWKVDDEATAAFMQLFYRAQIVDRLSTAAALRAAQQSMRGQKRWEDPYYWSGFILQGEW
jgi:CHAT domain-containing protein